MNGAAPFHRTPLKLSTAELRCLANARKGRVRVLMPVYIRAVALAVMFVAGTTAFADDAAKDLDIGVDVDSVQNATPDELRKLSDQFAGYGKKVQETLNEKSLHALVGMSPLLRQIVCRVPFQRFEVSSLARALQLPEPSVLHGVQLLERMGLIALKDEYEGRMVVPANLNSANMMRRWAFEWCDSDDTCGVRR